MYKKLLLGLLVGIIWVGGSVPVAEAITVSELQQKIAQLQEQIKQLKLLVVKNQSTEQSLAGSHMVIDLSTSAVISQKNSSQEYPIASITKLMNAVVASENIDADQRITLQQEMLRPFGYSPSLFLNSMVSAKDLLKASLIQSVNDASESLSYFVGHDTFVSLMNQKAKALGMENTHFYDAHGLSLQNTSTAADLAKLIAYIYQNHPEILAITKDNNFWLPDPTGKLLKFQNLNGFYASPEFIGGKTGYLPEAKQSIASVFTINGKPMALVVLYSKNRQADILKLIESVRSH